MRAILNDFDIRTKLVIVACLSSAAVFIEHIIVLLFLFLVSVMLSGLFYGRLSRTLRSTKKLWGIFLAIIVLQSIFNRSGEALLNIYGFPVLTMGGLLRGGEFLLRISILLFSVTIIASSKSREFVVGLVQLRLPYEFAFMVSAGIRFVPLLRNEFRDILMAIQLRGIDLKRIPFKKRMKVYSYLITPVLAGALHKAQKLSIAMETRAFRAYPSRTSYHVLTMGLKDYVVIFFTFLITIAVFISYYVFKFPGGVL